MEIYSTEEQQVDAIKKFWKDYGAPIVIGAVVGLGGLYGWGYFSEQKLASAASASNAFAQIQQGEQSVSELSGAIAGFNTAHDQQGYQALLQFKLAKTAVEAGELDKAAAALTQVIAAKAGAGLTELATLRLARIQAQQAQYSTALSTLETVTASAFAAQRDELKGDFYVRQGELTQAKAMYEAAQAALMSAGQSSSQLLQIKIDNLNQA